MTVIFTMLDGVRPDALALAETPVLDSICRRGAWTMRAQAVMPTLTLPCHVSIFYSVPPAFFGITDNTWSPVTHPFPGLIDQAALYHRRCAAFYSWEPLRDVSVPGSLEMAYHRHFAYEDYATGDNPVVEAATRYMTAEKPDFLFLYFGTPDIAGHLFGWMSAEYLAQISRVDALLGQFMETTTGDDAILIQSDHGGHERTHGDDIPEDMTIPWMVAGPGIRQDHAIQGNVTLLDTAPTLARLLGIPPHPQWEGVCVDEAFLGVESGTM